jgi:hypothetical protein
MLPLLKRDEEHLQVKTINRSSVCTTEGWEEAYYLRGEQPDDNPFHFSPYVFIVFSFLGYVQMNNGPHTEAYRRQAC